MTIDYLNQIYQDIWCRTALLCLLFLHNPSKVQIVGYTFIYGACGQVKYCVPYSKAPSVYQNNPSIQSKLLVGPVPYCMHICMIFSFFPRLAKYLKQDKPFQRASMHYRLSFLLATTGLGINLIYRPYFKCRVSPYQYEKVMGWIFLYDGDFYNDKMAYV